MAGSRLERIGTIFSRTSGLLRSGAMKPEDKPLWYDVYAAFPPHVEPRYDRPAPNTAIRPIFYEEDRIRAKYHKKVKHFGTLNLSDTRYQTQTQQFIEAFNKIKAQGALDEEQIFEAALDVIREKLAQEYDSQPKASVGLLSSFSEAKSSASEVPSPPKTSSIDLKNIFKE